MYLVMNIKERVDKIIEDKIITRAEYQEFLESVMDDGEIDPQESEQITRLRKLIDSGKLKVE